MASKKNLVINDSDRRDAAGGSDRPSRGNSVAWVMNGFALHGYALHYPISWASDLAPANEDHGSSMLVDGEYRLLTNVADGMGSTGVVPVRSEIVFPHRPEAGARSSVVLSCILGCARILHKAWKAYQREREIGRAIARLSELDDHVLRDIGLHRSEIAEAVRRGAPRDGGWRADV